MPEKGIELPLEGAAAAEDGAPAAATSALGTMELENEAGAEEAAYRAGEAVAVWAERAMGEKARMARIAGRRRFMEVLSGVQGRSGR